MGGRSEFKFMDSQHKKWHGIRSIEREHLYSRHRESEAGGGGGGAFIEKGK